MAFILIRRLNSRSRSVNQNSLFDASTLEIRMNYVNMTGDVRSRI